MLVQELVDAHVASANSDLNLVLLDSHIDALSTELVHTRALSHEHEFELVTVGVIVDELSDATIDEILFDRYVNSDSGLQIDDVVFEVHVFRL